MNTLQEHIEEIIQVNNDEFKRIQTFFKERKVKKHQYLIAAGDIARYEFWVVKGLFKTFYIDAHGKEHIVQFPRENWWMSDYEAYFNEKEASMFIQCLEDAEVLCLTLQGREKLTSEFHKMEHFFRIKLTNGYVALEKRIRILLSSTPQQRYEEFTKLYPGLLQRIPKKYIAEYLGITRETLSRLYSS